MDIDTLESVRLGGTTQWIRVRRVNASQPVVLLIQPGPVLPIINEARTFERRLGLEMDFTVVYWDQRGTGLSTPSPRNGFRDIAPNAIQMVDDTVSLLQLLSKRFGAKTF